MYINRIPSSKAHGETVDGRGWVRSFKFSFQFCLKYYAFCDPKAGFPLANFFARSEIFFCLYPISSRWFQLRDQRQMKNSLRAKKFSSGKPA